MTKTVMDPLLLAINLVAAIGDQVQRDEQNWSAGYRYAARVYFELGRDTGRAEAERAQDRRWAPIAEHVHQISNTPGRAELQLRRAEPGNLWRYRDGRAVQPDAFTSALIRRGVYTGGPVDWETSQPVAEQGAA